MKSSYIIKELTLHLPYSIFFTAAGIILAALLTFVAIVMNPDVPVHQDAHEHETVENEHHECHHHKETEPDCRFTAAAGILFHIFHPIHLLFSAMATTAMFFRHERKYLKAIVVGALGSIGICGISDIFMPFLGGNLLNLSEMHFHWCLLVHPQMVIPFVAVGIFAGFIAAKTVHNSTIISHSAHIFVSAIASLFYLISFGVTNWYSDSNLPYVFLIVILCVTIPCCLSDIVFPLLVARSEGSDDSCCFHSHGTEKKES